MRLGIVSSQKNPQDPKNWVRFHVDVGIYAFYLVIEDTPELGPMLTAYAAELSPRTGNRVTVYFEDAPSIDRSKEDNYTDLMSRQQERVDRMIAKARGDGVDWVFHVDDDELLYPGSKQAISTWQDVLGELPSSCKSVHIQNWEAFSPVTPKSSWATDAGVRYLPRACAGQFAAYANGKSATRTVAGQQFHGPHHFRGGKECELDESKGVVLHHEALAMSGDDVPPERWVQKNLLRVDDDLTKIPFVATHDAIHAVKSGQASLMEETWKKYRSMGGERFAACKTPVQLNLPSYKY